MEDGHSEVASTCSNGEEEESDKGKCFLKDQRTSCFCKREGEELRCTGTDFPRWM